MNTRYIKRLAKGALLFGASLFTMTSCGDFFDAESTFVVDADKSHLDNANDTIYSMVGVLNKLQAIADRTILLGEARGDLVTITEATSNDLRDLAMFTVSDAKGANKYNNPADYYAVINNCNYYIAHADTAKTDSHGAQYFLNEYAAVKAIRAWTYLQLVITYGKVPFYTEPLLSQDIDINKYPKYGIKEICNYFINNDGLQALAANDKVIMPSYPDIKSTKSKLFFFPINIVLGDLNLWAENYLEAAKCYHEYLVKRNGETDCYPVQYRTVEWSDNKWSEGSEPYDNWTSTITGEGNGKYDEVISIIPMDSIPSEGYYSELRAIFNTDFAKDNDYRVSLVPSQAIKNLSASQKYCYYDIVNQTYSDVSSGLGDYKDGDLRLQAAWKNKENGHVLRDGSRIDDQQIIKTRTKNGNIHIYRRSQVYLRYAEAMNRAGFPIYAYMILANGVNHNIVSLIADLYPESADLLKNNFDFHANTYHCIVQFNPITLTKIDLVGEDRYTPEKTYGSIGIHSHGSGWAGFYDTFIDGINNRYGYDMPTGTLEEQQLAVEDMIIDENALEMAFEGTRFYDLMRVALRRNDPSYLANKIAQRNEGGNGQTVSTNLLDKKNWFLRWNNQIGMY